MILIHHSQMISNVINCIPLSILIWFCFVFFQHKINVHFGFFLLLFSSNQWNIIQVLLLVRCQFYHINLLLVMYCIYLLNGSFVYVDPKSYCPIIRIYWQWMCGRVGEWVYVIKETKTEWKSYDNIDAEINANANIINA